MGSIEAARFAGMIPAIAAKVRVTSAPAITVNHHRETDARYFIELRLRRTHAEHRHGRANRKPDARLNHRYPHHNANHPAALGPAFSIETRVGEGSLDSLPDMYHDIYQRNY